MSVMFRRMLDVCVAPGTDSTTGLSSLSLPIFAPFAGPLSP